MADFNGLALVFFLTRAREAGIKYPKVRLSVNGERFVAALSGPKAKVPGTVNLTDGRPFGENTFFGSIAPDGEVRLTREATADHVKVLRVAGTDPVRTVAAYGKRTGTCSCCGRHLEDYRSVSKGYGPVCADNWGLPWGDVDGNPGEYSEADA